MSICMNPECRVKGRCDYCDARCPYYAENYIDGEALLQAIEGLPKENDEPDDYRGLYGRSWDV